MTRTGGGGPAALPAETLIECAVVGKVFRTWRREKGWRGVWTSFFAREPVDYVALERIDLRVGRGEFVGLIGPNGAGKTTLVKVLCGIVPTTSGRATVLGRDSFELDDARKARIALVMGQRSQLWWDLPPIDSFHLLREVYQVERATFERRVGEYAERLGVVDRLTVPLRHLSLGQRMMMEIIGAFLHDPLLVFLDEPTIGLDLVSRETIRRALVELNRDRGATIVLTSHDMEDIEATCQRLVILSEGRILYDGDLVALQRRIVGRRAIEIHLEPGSRGLEALGAGELAAFGAEVAVVAPLALTFLVPAERSQALIRHLLATLEIRDLAIERQPLESLIKEIFARKSLHAEGPVARSAP
jgi:ABC-2 type transport system ATP-binding protein